MSIIGWFLKSKKSMSNKHTRPIRMGKYKISSHAQNRVADSARNLRKKDMVQNLFGKSIQSNSYLHRDNKTIQYDRLNRNNQTITNIVENGNVVKTIRKYHKRDELKEINKLGEKRNGRR